MQKLGSTHRIIWAPGQEPEEVVLVKVTSSGYARVKTLKGDIVGLNKTATERLLRGDYQIK